MTRQDSSGGGARPDRLPRRVVDVMVSAIGLVLLSPLLLVVAIAIKLDSRGPVLFRQVRVGRGRRLFRILKFRSMVVGSDRSGPRIAGKADDRITRVGRWLRDTKIDELPQLWNVLRGDLTLIGPRAEVPEMIRHYTEEELQLLEIRPGLTGPGAIYFTTDQAAGLDGVEDAEEHYVEQHLHPKLALDLDYARRRSPVLDLVILRDTLGAVLASMTPARGKR